MIVLPGRRREMPATWARPPDPRFLEGAYITDGKLLLMVLRTSGIGLSWRCLFEDALDGVERSMDLSAACSFRLVRQSAVAWESLECRRAA